MTALERQMAVDAVALSKEHADRAGAAEARWTALREHIALERAARDTAAADHSELPGHESQTERAYGRVEALDALLATMDRMEAGR